MERPAIRRPGAVLTGWALLVLAGFVFTAGLDSLLLGYARYRRAIDYRTYLTEAGRLAQSDRYGQAFFEVRRALQLAPARPDPYEAAGDLHYQLGHWESALDAYRRAMERGSSSPGTRINAVWALIEQEHYEEAVELGRESIAAGYAAPQLPRYVAEALMRSGKYKEAIPYFREALVYYPDNQYLWGRLREAYEATGDRARAAEVADRIEQIEGRLDADMNGITP